MKIKQYQEIADFSSLLFTLTFFYWFFCVYPKYYGRSLVKLPSDFYWFDLSYLYIIFSLVTLIIIFWVSYKFMTSNLSDIKGLKDRRNPFKRQKQMMKLSLLGVVISIWNVFTEFNAYIILHMSSLIFLVIIMLVWIIYDSTKNNIDLKTAEILLRGRNK